MLMKQIKQPSSKQPNKFQAFANKLGPLVYNGLIKRGYTKRSTYDNVMSQLAFESTYGTSPLALRAHNYGGYGYNGKDYNVYKNDAAFIDAYLNDMAGKYKKALNADTVADYAKELKRIGYFEAPLDQYTKNLAGMQSVRKAAAVHYGQPIVQQKPALMAVQQPKTFIPQETAQAIEESAQNAFKQPVLPPVGRGPQPQVEVPQQQGSPFIFEHSIDLPPIEQTMGAVLNDQPIVNLPGYKGGKDDESLRYFAKGAKNAGFVGQDQSGNNYNIDWDTVQRRGNKIYAVVSNGKNKGLSDITQATTDVGQYESPFILDDVLVTAPRLQKNTSKPKGIDTSNVQPRMLQNTSSPTYAKDQAKAKTGDIDKVMLGTLGLSLAPIAAQAAPAALAPGGAFWSSPITDRQVQAFNGDFDLINKDGSINKRAAARLNRKLKDNGISLKDNVDGIKFARDLVNQYTAAKEFPIPDGSTRKQFVEASLLNKLIGAKDYSRPNMLLRKNDFKNIFGNEFDDDVINAAYETEKVVL